MFMGQILNVVGCAIRLQKGAFLVVQEYINV